MRIRPRLFLIYMDLYGQQSFKEWVVEPIATKSCLVRPGNPFWKERVCFLEWFYLSWWKKIWKERMQIIWFWFRLQSCFKTFLLLKFFSYKVSHYWCDISDVTSRFFRHHSTVLYRAGLGETTFFYLGEDQVFIYSKKWCGPDDHALKVIGTRWSCIQKSDRD